VFKDFKVLKELKVFKVLRVFKVYRDLQEPVLLMQIKQM
jgi:hypothetical protein